MPSAELRIAEEFSAALAEIYSTRVLSRIESVVRSLAQFPEMGSPRVRRCLVEQYGDNLRQVPVSTFWSCIATTRKQLMFLPLSTDLPLFSSV